MINIFKLAGLFMQKVKAASSQSSTLRKLSLEHPACRITTTSLRDVSMGQGVAILNDAYLEKVSLGSFSYVSNNSKLANVEIGNFCSIGPEVQIGLGPHPSRVFISTYPAFYTNQNNGCPSEFRKDKIFDDSIPLTTIGHDVWIGANAIIPGGINIGSGSIIAAGAVVVKDVPPYAVVGGNPARVIRYRFSDEQMVYLLASKWWEWPIDKIIRNVDNFADFDKFRAIGN
jgi:acetyltransferase-like isoleucine patch superfamily enzyme